MSMFRPSVPVTCWQHGGPVQSPSHDNGDIFNRVTEVTTYLYLAGAPAVSPETLRHLGIDLVINCTLEIPNLKMTSIKFLNIRVEDVPHARIELHFDQCADKIEEIRRSGGKTLVHCVAGVSRSATICIAYLMKYRQTTLLDAHDFVKQKRPIIRPNAGFFTQLIGYERRLFGKNTVTMVQSPIGPIPDIYQNEVRRMVSANSTRSSMPSVGSPRSSINLGQN